MAPVATLPKAKKAKTSNGGRPKKMTAYNKFMKVQLALLIETEPDISHAERFKLVTASWANAAENPKNSGKALVTG